MPDLFDWGLLDRADTVSPFRRRTLLARAYPGDRCLNKWGIVRPSPTSSLLCLLQPRTLARSLCSWRSRSLICLASCRRSRLPWPDSRCMTQNGQIRAVVAPKFLMWRRFRGGGPQKCNLHFLGGTLNVTTPSPGKISGSLEGGGGGL